ncbi:MAG: SOS response-associated peptidase family protein [Methylacidiphilales bacterium]|nr:SOS response-associated peptidase family protein [Candidatus Methylacidiphilales bacterium]
MCATFEIKTTLDNIAKHFGNPLKTQDPLITPTLDLTVKGFMKTQQAPLIYLNNGEYQLVNMAFSLCPSWAKVYPFTASTYNARLERINQNGNHEYIYQVPTWKQAWKNATTCLVPMTGAIESCHYGKQKGHVVRFHQLDNEVFFVAGLYSNYTEANQTYATFTILTDTPYPYFHEQGHDRGIVVLKPSAYQDWLHNPHLTNEQRLAFVREARCDLPWNCEPIRSIKKIYPPRELELETMDVWGQKIK